ncbi:MAG: YihY/virulence factor BrkB family protein [Acidobacteria bacterium]|nr:YihY/virulence factor BrkB family protein [Acidobacteriota bacterium]
MMLTIRGWRIRGWRWKTFGRNLWTKVNTDDVLNRAAILSFYFLLALFPLLLFLIALLGSFADTGTELRHNLLTYLRAIVPVSASDLINTTVDEISKKSSGGKLSFGLVTSLWFASSGMGAIIEGLNIAYDVKETRAWWRRTLLAIVLTIALAVLIITALALMFYGSRIAEGIANRYGFGAAFTAVWTVLRWLFVLVFVFLAFQLIYYFAPDLHEQQLRWLTPGAAVGVILWLLVSFLFGSYLNVYNTYSVVYGSLGAVIILLLWFYLTGVTILIGGEVNALIEQAAARAGDPEAKAAGEKLPDESARVRAAGVQSP